jgi:hypothetical protein
VNSTGAGTVQTVASSTILATTSDLWVAVTTPANSAFGYFVSLYAHQK